MSKGILLVEELKSRLSYMDTLQQEHKQMYDLLKMVAVFGLDATLKEDVIELVKRIKQGEKK